jgi:hypothetical protein
MVPPVADTASACGANAPSIPAASARKIEDRKLKIENLRPLTFGI